MACISSNQRPTEPRGTTQDNVAPLAVVVEVWSLAQCVIHEQLVSWDVMKSSPYIHAPRYAIGVVRWHEDVPETVVAVADAQILESVQAGDLSKLSCALEEFISSRPCR